MDPPSYKIVVLGDSSVGKTSLVHRFTTNEFDQNLANTIGAAFITKDYLSETKNLKFEIWDTAGQERYRSLTPMYYRNSKVALVCYDLTDIDQSFSKAKYWIDQLELNNESSDDRISIIVVGTKKDLVTHPNTSIVSDFVEANPHTHHYLTSAKTGEGITQIFDYIIDAIPEQFFIDHYEHLRQEDSKVTLNSHFAATDRCC